MKSIQSPSDLQNKTLKLGTLLLSTLIIVGASVLVYTRVVYEKALTVGGVGATPPAVNSAPETILVLAVLAFVISLSMFGFLRELSKRKIKPLIRDLSPEGPVLASRERQEAPDSALSPQLSPIPREWEEAPNTEDSET